MGECLGPAVVMWGRSEQAEVVGGRLGWAVVMGGSLRPVHCSCILWSSTGALRQ